jgi:hypothetical protein
LNAAELADLERYLEPDERAELQQLLALDVEATPWVPLEGPQQMAYGSQADVVGFGGAAGGGKTDLACGKALNQHQVVQMFRREGTELGGIIDRMEQILGHRNGLGGKPPVWRAPHGSCRLIEFGSAPNLGDERKFQGRAKDLLVIDEAANFLESQVRFLMGWVRTVDPTQRTQTLMTFNPPTTSEGRWVVQFFAPWLDRKFAGHGGPAQPGELRFVAMVDGVEVWVPSKEPFDHKGETLFPQSRTFVPSRVSDNPYLMGTNYMTTLQALPEPLRSQMLYGDFQAGMTDDVWQVIPTAWVEAAQARWKPRAPKGEMLSMGVDVARGGADLTVIATRHMDDSGKGMWFDELHEYPGKETPDGPQVAGLTIAHRRDDAPIHLDVIGVGASPYDVLNGMSMPVLGVNVSEKALGTDKSGRLRFFNQRSELWWKAREALDPANDTGIALPPSKKLLLEMCAPKWTPKGFVVYVEGREDIVKRLGYSPDRATAVILALIDTPKVKHLQGRVHTAAVLAYDPMAQMNSQRS